MNEQVKNDIFKLVNSSRDAIACSVDETGFPNAKTMFVRAHEDLRTFWFSSNVSAERTKSWQEDSKACIYFLDSEAIHGLMLIGEMEVCTDDETKKAYWQPGDIMYYSQGPTDPDYCMLKFTADKGNYWGAGKHVFNAAEIKE